MRPKCGVPRWKSASRRGTRTSIGPKILLAAILVVAGVIGIGGIYPQVTDAEWVRDAVGTHPSPPRRATNTGQASVSAPNRAPAAELSQSAAALEPPLDAAAGPNALPADPVGAAAAKSGDKPGNKPTDKARVTTAKKRVVRAEHHRRDSSSYVQYGASWGGWPGSLRLLAIQQSVLSRSPTGDVAQRSRRGSRMEHRAALRPGPRCPGRPRRTNGRGLAGVHPNGAVSKSHNTTQLPQDSGATD